MRQEQVNQLVRRLGPHAQRLEWATDGLAIIAGLGAGLIIRNIDGGLAYDTGGLVGFGLGFIVLFRAMAFAEGLYRGRTRYGSFDEVASLALVATTTTVISALINSLIDPHPVPVSVAILTGILALGAMAAIRYAWRLLWERSQLPTGHLERVLVVGAGEGGARLVRAMRVDPTSPYLPVGLIDDSPRKQNLRIATVPVVGNRQAIADAGRRLEATAAVIAIPSAEAALIRELAVCIRDAGLQVLTVPPVHELLGGGISTTDVRPITPSDLLGRHEVETDLEAISDYITGHDILVTGAGGSIGAELCLQLHQFAPRRLVMVDRDESGLHETHMRLHGHGLFEDPDTVVADIRDSARMIEIFEATRPTVVFHAAALKHLPLLEIHPAEAAKTNVLGTLNVLDAARAIGVEVFVNISTDKAAQPASVLGFSKRITERLTAAHAATAAGTYLSVRFGNVLDSRGSVLTAFRRQIAAGGPITVTHPDVTRYFMTVEEAVQLVIQAGAIGASGHVLLLDMGEPVRIEEVARQLIAASGEDIDVVHTGLRPGEKLHETLVGPDEHPAESSHPLLTTVPVDPLDPLELRLADPSASPERQRAALMAAAHRTAVPGLDERRARAR